MRYTTILFLTSFLSLSFLLQAMDHNGFDLSKRVVEMNEIVDGGPERDSVPALTLPRFISTKEANNLYSLDDEAIIVNVAGIQKAYPIRILNWHGVVNDHIAGKDIVVAYCPLSGAGLVFDLSSFQEKMDFGVSGLIYQSAMLLYDKQSESLWSHLAKKAIAGPHAGRPLTLLPSSQKKLRNYLLENPNTQVLKAPEDPSILRGYSVNPYAGYDQDQNVYFPIEVADNSVPAKTRSLLVLYRKDALIIPIDRLDPRARKTRVSIGKRLVDISYDAKSGEISGDAGYSPVRFISGYWFALRTFYPKARVFTGDSSSKK
ncbi:MAG: hypothetical protein CMO81_02000 [Waddliaceae bacterium]|nr:hypothetical protein [Waddliaceae bacterium]